MKNNTPKEITPLAIFRFSTGRSAKDVSAAAKISPGTLQNLERGRSRPKIQTAQALSRELGVSISDLFPDPEDDART